MKIQFFFLPDRLCHRNFMFSTFEPAILQDVIFLVAECTVISSALREGWHHWRRCGALRKSWLHFKDCDKWHLPLSELWLAFSQRKIISYRMRWPRDISLKCGGLKHRHLTFILLFFLYPTAYYTLLERSLALPQSKAIYYWIWTDAFCFMTMVYIRKNGVAVKI